jgi:hypothetical protein
MGCNMLSHKGNPLEACAHFRSIPVARYFDALSGTPSHTASIREM